jgi:Na+/melibiose symporter-like transporter
MMTNKLGQAVAIGSVYVLLERIGYAPEGENSAAVVANLMAIYVVPPATISVLVAAIMWNFPLDAARQRALRAIIEARTAPTRTP